MDNDKKAKPETDKEAEREDVTLENEQVCTKPFDPENARSGDKEGPCKNGED